MPGTEEWRPVAEFPSYEVSNHGRVRRLGKTECLKPQISGTTQYQMVPLGRGNLRSVHRLVAIAFIPNSESKPCVDHRDGNRLNNHVNNLRWATRSENNWNLRSKSAFKGVSWIQARKTWKARIKINGKTISLGCYHDPLEAYYIYCAAAVFYFGDFACG